MIKLLLTSKIRLSVIPRKEQTRCIIAWKRTITDKLLQFHGLGTYDSGCWCSKCFNYRCTHLFCQGSLLLCYYSSSRDIETFRVWPEDDVSVSIQPSCKPHNNFYHQVIQFKRLHISSQKTANVLKAYIYLLFIFLDSHLHRKSSGVRRCKMPCLERLKSV